ncbi:hypothetical protein [Aestuariispira ectoiniformans]|uniref:hypothetical protein n=1 Tax=Aestuariispira ectoiniformans TaxID=2775080 RepID=UPI00223AEED8|nr:hypothetical protein [Aestuariispira ectoiniformans]
MPVKANPLKLNKLQARTLLLAQVLAKDPASGFKNEETGEVTLMRLPHAHGNHVHVGPYVVSAKDASGFGNISVWKALERKGLARIHGDDSFTITLRGQDYDTGLAQLLEQSDH